MSGLEGAANAIVDCGAIDGWMSPLAVSTGSLEISVALEPSMTAELRNQSQVMRSGMENFRALENVNSRLPIYTTVP